MVLSQLLAVAAGGAIGAVLRFLSTEGIAAWLGRGFPYGTLTVNTVGSVLIGFLFVLLVEKATLSTEWRLFLVPGFLGAFTTFSTFSLDTLQLILHGELGRAVINVVLSVALGLVAVWLGLMAGRQMLLN